MKLATYKDGSRDGQLVVVSRDLSTAHYATGIATRLQQVLDDWNFLAPQLQDLSLTLQHGKARHAFAFDPTQCMAPVPRASRWVAAQSYLSHVERCCAAQAMALPPRLKSEPLLAHRAADLWLGGSDDVPCPALDQGLDFGPSLAVLCGDLAQGAGADQALESVRLLMLGNDWVLRSREAAEQGRLGAGVQARLPPSAAPVLVSLDELGEAWSRGRVRLKLRVQVNGQALGELDTAADAQFHIGQLLAAVVRYRPLSAGTLLSLGVPAGPADPAAPQAACLLDRREQERASAGAPATPYLADGDSVRIELLDAQGQSLCGVLEHTVVQTA